MKKLLQDLAQLRIGYQARTRIEPDSTLPYRIIQLRDVRATVDWDAVVHFKPEREPERYLVGDGDVLLSSRGGAHVGLALSGVPANTLASSNFFILRVSRNDVLPQYLGWYLNQPAAQEYLRTRSQGTNTALVTKADIAELEVPVPSIDVQDRIVRVANLRRAEQELLQRLESRRDLMIQTVCQNALHPAKHTEA
jgi:hypothetical protein